MRYYEAPDQSAGSKVSFCQLTPNRDTEEGDLITALGADLAGGSTDTVQSITTPISHRSDTWPLHGSIGKNVFYVTVTSAAFRAKVHMRLD